MSNAKITALVLSLNGLYLALLLGFFGYRLLSGLSPMPEGYGPLAMAAAAAVPFAITGLGTFLRLRRDA